MVVLLIGDVAAASVENRRAESAFQSAEALPRLPHVHISGFPFTTQLITGHYRKIRLLAHQMHVPEGSDSLDFRAVEVEFGGVTASDSFHRFHATKVAGKAQLGYGSLSATLGARIRYAGAGQLKATRTVTEDGQTYHPQVLVRPSFFDGRLVFLDPQVGSADGAPASVTTALEHAFSSGLTVTRMPFGSTATGFRATGGGLDFTLSGKNVGYRS